MGITSALGFGTSNSADPELRSKLERLADGDTDVEFDDDSEVAELLAEVRDELDRYQETVDPETVDERQETIRAAADGDYTERMDTETGSEKLNELAEDYNAMMKEIEETTALLKDFADEVSQSSSEVESSAKDVRRASGQVSESIQEISEGAEEQSTLLQRVQSEMENLSASVEEVASSTQQVAELAEQTAETSKDGRENAEEAIESLEEIEEESNQAVEEMDELSEEIEQIDELVDFISEVAEQTNMLATNASIEAARAGEAGEGFAVVADQVKELADETGDAADEIEESLRNLQEQAESTSETVEETQSRVTENRDVIEGTVESLNEIADLAEETNNGIQEINQTADQQAETTQQVVNSVNDAATVSEETTQEAETVAAAAEEQASSLEQVLQRIEDLNGRADRLQDTLNLVHVRESLGHEAGGTGASDPSTIDTDDIDNGGDVDLSDLESDVGSDAEDELSTQVGTAVTEEDGDDYEVGVSIAQDAVREVDADRVDFGQVFISPEYEYEEVLSGIRSVIGSDADLIGSSSAGEFADDGSAQGGISLSVVASDTIQFFTGVGTGLSEDINDAIEQAVEQLPNSADISEDYPYLSAINLHDGFTGKAERIALATQRKLGQRVRFAGGSAGDDFNLEGTHVFDGENAIQDGVVIALLASKNNPSFSVEHGHEPITEELEVTKAEGGTIHEINGEPAIDKWKELIYEDAKENLGIDPFDCDDEDLGTLFAVYEVGIPEGDGEYKVRWPGLREAHEGAMQLVVDINEGETIQIMRGKKEDQIESAREAAKKVRQSGNELAGAFVYDCACRAAILEDDYPKAVKAMDDELNVPFAGFEAYGEMCMARAGSSGFHNTTSVIFGLPK